MSTYDLEMRHVSSALAGEVVGIYPGSLWAVIVPPISSTSSRVMASPNPVPP
jgi:hypothetical protein